MTHQQSATYSDATFVRPLTDITRDHVNLVGSKAANLGELMRAGLPVPHGVVLTTTAFQHFLDSNALDVPDGPDDVIAASLPQGITRYLHRVIEQFEDATLAVRSSGVAEDLHDASFAGQYETILNVRGITALSAAVRQCWASAFTERVMKYQATKGKMRNANMAILIQCQIPADAAGVAFSANPVTGDRQECIINAVRGLGERLVSGQATPDEWIVRGDDVRQLNAPEDAITRDTASAIAALARRAESHFGVPQDIEWALTDSQLFLLQARPVTALPDSAPELVPIPIEVPPGFWQREAAHFPDPLTPMLRSALLPLHECAIYRSMEENSMLIEGVQFREIGGWLYQREVPLGGKDRAPPLAWLMPILIRLVPSMRRRIKGLVNVVRTDKPMQDVERWYTEWRPRTIERINSLRQVDVESLTDPQLITHLEHVLSFIADCLDIHALITAADFLVAELALICKDLLGWDGRQSLELLTGLSSQTTEPTSQLFTLVQYAQQHGSIRQLLDDITPDTPAKLATIDETFATAFTDYLERFGYRTLKWDLNEPTLSERPELVLKMIYDQITHNYDLPTEIAVIAHQRTQALEAARRSLAAKSTADQDTFEHVLERAKRAYPVREEHEFYLSNVPLALLRYSLLEIGRRLTAQGKLKQPDDIFFLEYDEATNAFQKRIDYRQTVRQRKGELAWAKAHPGPAFYGNPPHPPPSTTAFPREAQHAVRVVTWLIESLFASNYLQNSKTASPDGSLTGLAASPGEYTGQVRVIQDETEFSKLHVGDVLVCPTTQPPWSVLFPSIGALVTDHGGILSHPAIIAREFHIPAVVATHNATHILRDGQIVTVNGTTGRITIVTS